MTDSDLIVLQHAHRKISELLSNEELHKPIKTKIEMKHGRAHSKSSGPTEMGIKSAAVDVRQFLLKNSPIQMGKLLRIIRENVHVSEHATIKEVRRLWTKNTENEDIIGLGGELVLNGESIGNKKLIDLMINGEYFHLDEDKAAKIAYMRGNPALDIAKMNFVMLLHNLIEILRILDEKWIQRLIKNETK